jgi:hypothetical protein
VKEQQGHGLDEYLEKLNALPNEVVVRVQVDEDRAEFDRRVRESIERGHRRAQIAGG